MKTAAIPFARAVLFALFALFALGATAHADVDPVSALAEAAARSHAGDHAGATRIYEQVYRRDHDPAVLVILGHEYTSAGRFPDALQHFCAYLAVDPTGADAATALAQLEILRAQLGLRGDACAAPPIAPPGLVAVAAPSGLSRREQLGIGAAALGVVALAFGGYYGHMANATSDQIMGHDPSQPWPANAAALESLGHRYEIERDVFLGAGVTALVAAGVLYVTGREERLSVAPLVSRGGGGVAIGRAF